MHETTTDPPLNLDGVCVFPTCESTWSIHVQLPLCNRHILKVYSIAGALVKDTFPKADPDAATRGRSAVNAATPGVVYFVRLGSLIKIGFTTNLVQRLRDVPHEEVLGVTMGTMRDEKAIHGRFAHLRQSGEWFRPAPDLEEFIAALGEAA